MIRTIVSIFAVFAIAVLAGMFTALTIRRRKFHGYPSAVPWDGALQADYSIIAPPVDVAGDFSDDLGSCSETQEQKENPMKYKTLMILAVTLLVACSLTWAADVAVDGIKSARVKRAMTTYSRAVERVDECYAEELAALDEQRDDYLAELREAVVEVIDAEMKRAVAREDLDEAVALRDLQRAIEAGEGVSTLPEGAVEYGGHHYLLVNGRVDIEGAIEACEDMGGYLVRIEDVDEFNFVKGLLEDEGTNRQAGRGSGDFFWVGGQSDPDSNGWIWDNGETVTLHAWAEGQPPQDDLQRYVVMHRTAGAWLAITGDETHGFVCEIESADAD